MPKSPDRSALKLITTSSSTAPASTAAIASRFLIDGAFVPWGNPITVQALTGVLRRRETTIDRSAGRQHTVAVCHAIATSTPASTSCLVISGLSRAWSMRPIRPASSRPLRLAIGRRFARRGFIRLILDQGSRCLPCYCECVRGTRIYGHHAGHSGGHVRLVLVVGAPGAHGSVRLEGHAEAAPGRGRGHARSAVGNVRLAFFVRAPADNRAVGLDDEIVRVTGAYRLDAREAGRNRGKTGRNVRRELVAPGDDGTVGFEGEAEVVAGRNGNHAGQAGRDDRLTVGVTAPGNDRAIGLE